MFARMEKVKASKKDSSDDTYSVYINGGNLLCYDSCTLHLPSKVPLHQGSSALVIVPLLPVHVVHVK